MKLRRTLSFAIGALAAFALCSVGAQSRTGSIERNANERLAAATTNIACGIGGLGDLVTFEASGGAKGTYHGTFSVAGQASVDGCRSGTNVFQETFTIQLGARTINGSASGSAAWSCAGTMCSVKPNRSWTYEATLVRGLKVLRTFSGSVLEGGISPDGFDEVLNGI